MATYKAKLRKHLWTSNPHLHSVLIRLASKSSDPDAMVDLFIENAIQVNMMTPRDFLTMSTGNSLKKDVLDPQISPRLRRRHFPSSEQIEKFVLLHGDPVFFWMKLEKREDMTYCLDTIDYYSHFPIYEGQLMDFAVRDYLNRLFVIPKSEALALKADPSFFRREAFALKTRRSNQVFTSISAKRVSKHLKFLANHSIVEAPKASLVRASNRPASGSSPCFKKNPDAPASPFSRISTPSHAKELVLVESNRKVIKHTLRRMKPHRDPDYNDRFVPSASRDIVHAAMFSDVDARSFFMSLPSLEKFSYLDYLRSRDIFFPSDSD